jgi:antitoxin FitA
MANIQLNNIPDELLHRIQQLAEQHRRTLDDEILQILQQATQPNPESKLDILQLIEEGKKRREQLPQDINWLDSTALIREDRDR